MPVPDSPSSVLSIATAGTQVRQDNGSPNGPQGSQNIVIGKSGGQGNLFGNIPGKAYAIDVTVSRVSVAGDLNVTNVSADVLIGDV